MVEINRRDFLGTSIKAGTAIGIGGMIGVPTFLETSCSSTNALSAAKEVVSAIQESLPYFQQLPNSGDIVNKITAAIDIGNKFITAFQNNDISTGLGLADSLIAAFQDIANNTKLFPIPTQVTVLAILGIGNIALHVIVDWADANKNSVKLTATRDSRTSIGRISTFKDEPIWGKKLHK